MDSSPTGKTNNRRARSRRLTAAAGALVLLGAAALYAGDRLLASYRPEPFYTGPGKVWAHRGYCAEGLAENSLEAFARAFELGAPGTELDVFYDVGRDRFVVAHDEPASFGDARLLTLEAVFARFGPGRFYWLDFKNLRDLPPDGARAAAAALKTLVSRHALRDAVIVESTHAGRLALVAEAGLFTSYWVQLNPEEPAPKFRYHISRVRLAMYRGRFSALSMEHTQFSGRVERALHGLPVHLFTINDPGRLRELARKDTVRVLLTDLDGYRNGGVSELP